MDRQNCVRCGKPLSRFEAHEMTHCIEWLRDELEREREEKKPRYHAMHFSPDNPMQLKDWLNQICFLEQWELVAATGEYFIFRSTKARG